MSPRGSREVAYPVDDGRKAELLCHLIVLGRWKRTVAFAKSGLAADRLAGRLQRGGLACASVRKGQPRAARDRTLEEFRSGELSVLIASDLEAGNASFGSPSHVVNLDVPPTARAYAERAAAGMWTVSMVSDRERRSFEALERDLGRPIRMQVVVGFATRKSPRVDPF